MIERVPAGALATRSHPTHRQRGGTAAYRVCQAGRQKHYRLIQNRASKLRFRHAEGCCQVTGSERPRARKKVNSCSLLTRRQSRVRNGHNRAWDHGGNRRPTEKSISLPDRIGRSTGCCRADLATLLHLQGAKRKRQRSRSPSSRSTYFAIRGERTLRLPCKHHGRRRACRRGYVRPSPVYLSG